jgi:polysaccharide export outer membrane protein
MAYKRHSLFLLITSIFIFLCGCSTDYATKTPPTVDFAIKKKTERLNEVIMVSAANKTNTTDDYLIGAEDLLDIEAYNVEELKKTVRVNSQGDIALPLIGIIRAKGMTTSELEGVIARKLERYVQETVVNVFVKEYHSQRISVIGAINNPQVYAVTGQRCLIDMLMTAGGLREEAGNICYVIRPANNSPDSRTATIVIDLDELLINGNFALNIPVFAGDVINVPKGGVIFVDGAVKNPGVFTIRSKTTVIQAITMAKGVDSNAKLSDIRIFRDNGKGDRDVIPVDYDAIRKGESPDIFLVENDIIIVPQSGIKNFFNGFISGIRGLISFGSGSLGVGM